MPIKTFSILKVVILLQIGICRGCYNITCMKVPEELKQLQQGESDIRKCMQFSEDNQVEFYYDVCDYKNKEHCDVILNKTSGIQYGKCVKNTKKALPQSIQLFPGEPCNIKSMAQQCVNGRAHCFGGVCQGFELGEECSSSLDCNPGLYCNLENHQCQNIKKAGDACYGNHECPSFHLCYFNSDEKFASGICTQKFSLPSGSPVYLSHEEDLQLCQGGVGIPLYLQSNSLSLSDLHPHQTYQCSNELISLNPGKFCQSHFDCPSTQTGLFATCRCSSSAESERCDILPGNSEYLSYVAAMREFVEETRHCHSSRTVEDGPCTRKDLYKDMMCKRAKALSYAWAFGGEERCLVLFSTEHVFHQMAAVKEWCVEDHLGEIERYVSMKEGAILEVGIMAIVVALLSI